MLTKLQIGFCVAAGVGIVIFAAGMFSNINVSHVPGWLAPVAWGSFVLVVGSCVGVVATMILDREKEPGDDEEEEAELPPETPPPDESTPDITTDGSVPELTTEETSEPMAPDLGTIEFAEPGSEEAIEFSTLPTDEE